VESKRDNLKRAVRKTVKWGGAGLTLLLLVVWIGSGWWGAVWFTPSGGFGTIHGGQLRRVEPLSGGPSTGAGTFLIEPIPSDFEWWFDWGTASGTKYVDIPLWPAALLSLLATAAAWRADAKYMRRARVGLCAGCGYDRAGLAAGAVCPECGAAASRLTPPTPAA